MPIVFEQPAPAGALTNIARQAGAEDSRAQLAAYTALSGQLQNRYAQESQDSSRASLGYAQLQSDNMLRGRALGLQAAELEMRPILQAAAIQQRARAELDQWVSQQQFTARDQQELNRQRNSLGELLSKRESGEITEKEFYQMAGQVAPRLNSLQERENFTKQKAMNEYRQQQAELFETQRKQREQIMAAQRGQLEGRVDVRVKGQHADDLARHMKIAYPGLPSGTPEYEAVSKQEALKAGWAEEVILNSKGDFEPVGGKAAKGSSGGGGQEKMDDANLDYAMKEANAARRAIEKDGGRMTPEQFQAEVDFQMKARKTAMNPGQQERDEKHVAGLKRIEDDIQATANDPDLPLDVRTAAVNAKQRVRDLRYTYPPGSPSRTPAIEAAIKKAEGEAQRLTKIADESRQKVKGDQELIQRQKARGFLQLFQFGKTPAPQTGGVELGGVE